jgi:hypothetical protein
MVGIVESHDKELVVLVVVEEMELIVSVIEREIEGHKTKMLRQDASVIFLVAVKSSFTLNIEDLDGLHQLEANGYENARISLGRFLVQLHSSNYM